jgi:hypothetical protein
MSTRSHTTNPTNVVHLPASVIEITVNPDDTFMARFNGLRDSVPDVSHRVSLVANAGNTSRAFDFGTVASVSAPSDTSIAMLDGDKPRVFRLIVWDPTNNRISASNERLRIRDADAPADREPLLPVRMAPLKGEVWRLALTDDARPELLLNSSVPGLKHRLMNVLELRAAILPEAVRQCLLHVFASPDFDKSDETAWQTKWLKFAAEMGVEPLDDANDVSVADQRAWADRVTESFALEHDFAKALAISWGSDLNE